MNKYTEKSWDHLNKMSVNGITSDQIEQHLALYKGYVSNLNLIREELFDIMQGKKTSSIAHYNELKRRYGWEFNGVRLHEYYFENLGESKYNQNSTLIKKINLDFGSMDHFINDFKKTAGMRGIGWVILYQDIETNNLFNLWIDDHDEGHGSGLNPILIMDVWEHAYCVDWKPTERAKYIEVFFNNIKWDIMEKRYKNIG